MRMTRRWRNIALILFPILFAAVWWWLAQPKHLRLVNTFSLPADTAAVTMSKYGTRQAETRLTLNGIEYAIKDWTLSPDGRRIALLVEERGNKLFGSNEILIFTW